MDDFGKIEGEIKAQAEGLPARSFSAVLDEISPRLKDKNGMVKNTDKKLKPGFTLAAVKPAYIIAVAAMLLFAGTLAWYLIDKNINTPPLRFSDGEVSRRTCSYDDMLEYDIYLPNFQMLSEANYMTGTHTETTEDVYYYISGYFDDGIAYREIRLYIIFNELYDKADESFYINLPNSFTSGDKTVTYSSAIFSDPFYEYSVSCVYNNVRYYCNYQTIEEHDVAIFFQNFIN